MRHLLAVATATMCAAVAGCGVPVEHDARPLPTPHHTTTSAPNPAESGPISHTLYLVKDGTLVPVQRNQPTEPDAEELLQELLSGPTTTETDAGITSALLGTNVAANVQVTDGRATVELTTNLEGTGRNDDVLAFAQIVCTLASRPDISTVTFTRDGQRLRVPRSDGSLTQQPLTPADYANLITQ